MSITDITEKIISDAETEAERIIAGARETADKIVADAEAKAEADTIFAKTQTDAKLRSYTEGVEASARQESAKIMLAAKRAVLDEVYSEALTVLRGVRGSDLVDLSGELLETYAEDGDEIVYAGDFPCVREVGELKVVKDRHLSVGTIRGNNIEGGFILRGANADKDLSFKALLEEDRVENESKIAQKLFKE